MPASTHNEIELSGSWTVAQCPNGVTELPRMDSLDWLPATVPSSVHYDLVRAGKLENPYASSAAAEAAAWVCASDWIFRKTFGIERPVLDAGLPALEFDGIDTFSDVWLNGHLLGRTANAYRSYRFPLQPGVIRAGRNELVVHVRAHRDMIASQVPAAREHLWTARNPHSSSGKSLLRRYQRSFFSGASLLNLGTEVLGIGLYKPVRLAVLPRTRVEDFHFQVETVSAAEATARVTVALVQPDAVAGTLTVIATLIDPETGETVATARAPVTSARAAVFLTVPCPKLWWPHGYGPAHLYRLRIDVADGTGVVSSAERRVGIRRAELVRDFPGGRRTFQFVVNGVRIWVRGQNLIPVDYVAVHGSDEEYDRLLRLLVEGNGNLVRIWGGGAIENDHFLSTCDELGIMLWQDFFLHSATYPDYDPAWVAEFRQESAELVRKLRNHPCLVILCGGNEQQQGWDEWGWQGELDRFYGEPLIKELLPEVSATEAPEVPYIANSPHGGRIEASPAEGEMHCWGNYVNATKDPLFVTETCWNLHSYSRPETLAATMGLDLDDFDETGWPGKWTALTRLPLITKYPYSDYFSSRTLRQYLDSLEIEHFQADHTAFKTLRLTAPSLTGIINWSFNKGAPLFEFGCVDYLGHPLMNFYAIKRLFADLVIGIYRDINDIRIVASSLDSEPVNAELRVTHFGPEGTARHQWESAVTLAPQQLTRIGEIDGYYPGIVDRHREIMHAQLMVEGTVVAEDTLYFVPIAEVETGPGPVSVSATKTGTDGWGCDSWEVELVSPSVQKLVRIEGNQKWLCSDNYFALVPGHTKRITVSLLERTSPDVPVIRVSALDVPGEQTLRLP